MGSLPGYFNNPAAKARGCLSGPIHLFIKALAMHYKRVSIQVMRVVMRILAVLAMTALFLWQASAAIEKYHSKVTSLQVIHTGKYIFTNLHKSINRISEFFWLILLSQIRKFIRRASPQMANSKNLN